MLRWYWVKRERHLIIKIWVIQNATQTVIKDIYITLQELQNERARELYTECTRRSDLIRYGKWISGYTWNWKGNVAGGTDFASNFTVYPLPSSVCARNGYEQNPGY